MKELTLQNLVLEDLIFPILNRHLLSYKPSVTELDKQQHHFHVHQFISLSECLLTASSPITWNTSNIHDL
jgi:hypothetical protein